MLYPTHVLAKCDLLVAQVVEVRTLTAVLVAATVLIASVWLVELAVWPAGVEGGVAYGAVGWWSIISAHAVVTSAYMVSRSVMMGGAVFSSSSTPGLIAGDALSESSGY